MYPVSYITTYTTNTVINVVPLPFNGCLCQEKAPAPEPFVGLGKRADGSNNRPHGAYPVQCRVPGYYEPCSEKFKLSNAGNFNKMPIPSGGGGTA